MRFWTNEYWLDSERLSQHRSILIVPIGQDSDRLHRFNVNRLNINWRRGGQSDTEQICVFRFLDNDYKASSSKPWLCIFSFRFSLSRNNCRLLIAYFYIFAFENPLYPKNRGNRFPWAVSELAYNQGIHTNLSLLSWDFPMFNPIDSDWWKRKLPIVYGP